MHSLAIPWEYLFSHSSPAAGRVIFALQVCEKTNVLKCTPKLQGKKIIFRLCYSYQPLFLLLISISQQKWGAGSPEADPGRLSPSALIKRRFVLGAPEDAGTTRDPNPIHYQRMSQHVYNSGHNSHWRQQGSCSRWEGSNLPHTFLNAGEREEEKEEKEKEVTSIEESTLLLKMSWSKVVQQKQYKQWL